MFNGHRLTRNGRNIAVPRYYRKKLLDELGDEYKELYQWLNAYREFSKRDEIIETQFKGDIHEFGIVYHSDLARKRSHFDRIEFEFRSKR